MIFIANWKHDNSHKSRKETPQKGHLWQGKSRAQDISSSSSLSLPGSHAALDLGPGSGLDLTFPMTSCHDLVGVRPRLPQSEQGLDAKASYYCQQG